jgi:hypothetical protein
LSGAFVGASASRIILGDRGTGGTIGSALGGVLGQKFGEKVLAGGLTKIASGLGSFAGPIGSALGGVLGGLLGGVFKSTTKGYAVVSNSGVSSGGNNSELVQQAASSGSGIQSTINQIAQQLGASVGSYSVSIGKRSSGWISVSASGSSQVADKSWKKANSGGDLIYDGKDEAAAIAVAISNAIADGAIAGISPKVKQALLSSTDIDQAVREAGKVQDLELALGGSAALEKEFRTFQQTAAERVTLAKKYGFDLVKVEELNNKERLALSQKLLKDQVGSLQDLIDQMTSGSLYEGSAVDQRNALQAKIAAAQAVPMPASRARPTSWRTSISSSTAYRRMRSARRAVSRPIGRRSSTGRSRRLPPRTRAWRQPTRRPIPRCRRRTACWTKTPHNWRRSRR